ncbi:MAG: dTDP-glucose 4,6-dehydratase [Gemmatimonadaceae bacterium]|nr:dTDP-glucose 4,6-dehydratase [Gemmatimonadaceae bacterium]
MLVTGGAGFIGSALVRHLVLERGLPVVTVDALTHAGHIPSLGEAATSPLHAFERADVANAAQVEAVLRRHRPRAIMHLAAESHVDCSINGPAALVHNNVVGTFTLLEQATRYWNASPPERRSAFRFLHVSTDEVFGALDDTGSFSLESPCRPSSPYAASKSASVHFARAWHHTYDLPVIVTNCSNQYGPYQSQGKLVPVAVRKALALEAIPVYESGRQGRDWLHVDDHARGLVAALERGRVGRTYVFGGGAERTNQEVVSAICDAVDALAPAGAPRRSLITHVTDRPGHDSRYAIDPSHTSAELGWSARRSFEEGLRETVAWYVANERWATQVLGEGCDSRRLGPGMHPGVGVGVGVGAAA